MRGGILLVLILTHSWISAQISDDFSDGNFTTNPTWSGTTGDYIVNASEQVQLTAAVAGTSYLSTPHGLSDMDGKEWKLWTRQSFAPSSSNYGRIYLTSSSADLSSNPDGFYLQLGEAGSLDAVRLFKCVSGTHTELLAGPSAQIAASFSIGIRVVRSAGGDWTLSIDGTGGTAYVSAGTVNDAAPLLGTHFGFLNVFTISNASGFYYDDIYVGDEIFDTDPPVLMSATAISATAVDVLFNEALDQVTAETTGNYTLSPALGISSAVLDGTNPALVHLTLAATLSNGQLYDLNTINQEDLSANVSGSQTAQFFYLVAETPEAGDVIINEFMCDPEPPVALPNVEFVEVYNKSNKIFNLTSWKLADASSSGTIQGGWLMPGEYRVLTATANVDSFAVAQAVSSFPSLNNSGDAIVLRSDLGIVIDSINYTDDWYNDPLKEDGGYSIERINPNDPCTDITDWRASISSTGGTPGAVNSVLDLTADTGLPSFVQLIASAPNYLEIEFSEGMDSLSLMNAVFSFQPSLTIQNQYVLSAFPTSSVLQFVEDLQPSQVYTIEMENVADCWLNSTTLLGQFALPDVIEVGDLIINEILSDPVTGGSDYVELYNNSSKLLDMKDLIVANYDDGTIGNQKNIPTHFLLYPDSYVVLTEDSVQLKQQYAAAIPGRYIEMDLPSWNNDSGTVYILNNLTLLDKVSYTDDWHFRLLDNLDGKSLERIDPNGASDSKENWHTAAESIGFGTPGRVNSQFYPVLSNGTFSFTSETVSPDNDGFEDVLQINYEMNDAGYLGTFTIFDDRGRQIATVFKSELLGVTGTFKWDGVREDGTKATIGTYVGVFEAFDISGGLTFTQRNAFVVAGKL
jgi:hypothetical protein